jgi:hypothetical protein
MHIIDINCTGSELSVLDCPHNGLSDVHICDHQQDASVRCQGTISNSISLFMDMHFWNHNHNIEEVDCMHGIQ